jgi:hypothetical protein
MRACWSKPARTCWSPCATPLAERISATSDDAVKREFLTSRRTGARSSRGRRQRWKAALSAASRNLQHDAESMSQSSMSMSPESKKRDKRSFRQASGAKAARKLQAQRKGESNRLVWPRHVRPDRLVCGGAHSRRRNARPLVGPAASRHTLLDAHAAGRRAGHRLRQRVALGLGEDKRHARRTEDKDA